MPFGIRPRPKPNPNAIRINSNFPNLPLNDKDNGNNKKQLGMGNVGNLETLIKLYCDLQTYGFCVVRQGHREGLPIDKPSVWVFCPLLKKKFPRDRVLVEDCKKCKGHYKGLSQPIENINRHKMGDKYVSFHVNMTPAKKKPKVEKPVKGEIVREEKDLEAENKRWEEEEKRIFGEK